VVKIASDEISPERQRVRGIAECERRGWVAEIFEDAEGHRSGRREQGRPGWLSLKAQLDRPDVVALVVESLSRASRSVKDLFNLLEELDAHEIALISLKEQLDTSSAMGRAFIGFIAVMNQFESDIASERMAANIAYKRNEKGRHWGRTPFGCTREGTDRVLVPSKDGATIDGIWRGYHEALIKCYQWYVEGETGLQKLATRLNDAGYRFRDRHGESRLFHQHDVRRLLDGHRIYSGFVPLGAAKDHPDEERKGSHAAILPIELCKAVAAMLEARHALSESLVRHRRPGRTYILSDILYCAGCGNRLVGMFQDGKQWYRHERAKGACPGRKGQFPAERIESQVMERLSQFAMPEQLKDRIRTLARRMMDLEGQTEWQEARSALRHQARKLENLKELRVEGEIDRAEYQRRKQEIDTAMRAEQAKLRNAPADVHDIEDLLPKVDQIAEVIRDGQAPRKKELLNALFERIEERNGEMTALIPRAWARPFFNGGFNKEGMCGIMAPK
jgi:DNA invertase Pin-like site-specific DNA recombinase